MKMPTIRVVAAFLCFTALGCSDARKKDKLSDIIATFGFHVVDMAQSKFETIDKLESLDRASYAPVSFERARIRSDVELDGWHGPTIGNYYLAIETYRTTEEALKRTTEYRDWERFAAVVGFDDPHHLGKTSLRCWAYPVGSRVYLLSTHAAMQSALEARTNSVLNGIKAYEERRGEQAGAGQPASRPESKSEGGDKPQPESEGRSR
jgi:hypothetical protein|tara:strand:+ start:87 stop:707 length:621 start_codon:yes stop_codon:yes gene_type:complete